MPSGPPLVFTALAACLAFLGCPASASSSSSSATDLAQATSRHSDIADAVVVFEGDASLEHAGRQLTVFTASSLLTNVGNRLVNAFLSAGVGTFVGGIAGGGAVPADLAALIDSAIREINAAVAQSITEAFNNERKTLLESLSVRVTEYTRRANLGVSRSQVQDMLDDASELVAFFGDNEVVTNGAFQTTVALRLALLLELLHLDQLLGESEGTLEAVRENIRRQARTAKADLESWRATYQPVTDTFTVDVVIPCTTTNPSRKCSTSTRERTTTVCMDLSSPGLKQPEEFCGVRRCTSNHFRSVIRQRRMRRCVNAFNAQFPEDIKRHVRTVALEEWRDLNEAAVFGEDFQQFLADLAVVQTLEFADVSSA